MNAILQGLFKNTGTGIDSVGSITPVANIAALEALTLTGNPDNAQFVYVDCYATAGDGGGGFFEFEAGSAATVDNAVTFSSAMTGRWVRQWDGTNFQAAWTGMFTTTADIGPLFKNVPKFCFCHFTAGVYTIATAPLQPDFSNVFWRGSSTIWEVTAPLSPSFSQTAIGLNWDWIPSATTQGIVYPINANSTDMLSAGLSPIEGIGILSQLDGNTGVGLALGMPVSGTTAAVRSTVGTTTTPIYFEVEFQANGTLASASANTDFGFSSATHDITGGVMGNDVYSVGLGYYCNGSLNTPASVSYDFNQRVAVALNPSTKNIWTKNLTLGGNWNATSGADPGSGTGGANVSALTGAPFFPEIQIGFSGVSATVYLSSGFMGAIPTGFSAAGGTLNPSDQYGMTFSNGNLTATGTLSGFPNGSTDPKTYYTRPKNYSVGGFYINTGWPVPTDTFLTGCDSVVAKGGQVGFFFNNNAPGAGGLLGAGENMLLSDCNLNGMNSDGLEVQSGQHFFLRNCSSTYNSRMAFISNENTIITGNHIETNPGVTPSELYAVDGGTTLSFDSGCTFFLIVPTSSFQWKHDIIGFYSGSGGYAQVFFEGPRVVNQNSFTAGASPTQFLVYAENQNVYGHAIGVNGQNFPYAISPNQTMVPDYRLASGGTTFFPGSTHATACTPATGSISLTSASFAAGQTFTVGGTAITAVNSGATGLQFNIVPGNVAATLANMLTVLQNSTDANLVKNYYLQTPGTLNKVVFNGITIYAKNTGTTANSTTLATTITGATLSGATMSGGNGLAISTASGYPTKGIGVGHLAISSFNGTAILQTDQWDVQAGELIFITFFDSVDTSAQGFTLSGVVNFFTGTGVTMPTQALTAAAGVPNFVPSGNLNNNWPSGSSHNWTYQNFVFRVPVGAQKMSMTINAVSTNTGANYLATQFCAYSNIR